MAASHFHLSSFSNSNKQNFPKYPSPYPAIKIRSFLPSSKNLSLRQPLSSDGGGGIGNGGSGRFPGGGGGDHDGDGANKNQKTYNPIALFLEGWKARVAADPQFPFKVLMEELVGVSATAAGDMASRPNFGLNELDFVFSTLVVGSIVNFTLMYLLAPTPNLVRNPLPSYIFEPGPYSFASRIITFFYKGLIFAAVGFGSGLAGTAISNGLVKLKGGENNGKKQAGPKTIENAATWALHMGLSANIRYQSLNGVEFVLGRLMHPVLFKMCIVVLRCLNNVAGGASFVALGRALGTQKKEVEDEKVVVLKDE